MSSVRFFVELGPSFCILYDAHGYLFVVLGDMNFSFTVRTVLLVDLFK